MYYVFFFFRNIFSLYGICYNIASLLCFGFLAMKDARS